MILLILNCPSGHGLLQGTVLSLGMTEELLKVDGQFSMEAEYYDAMKNVWEPVVESVDDPCCTGDGASRKNLAAVSLAIHPPIQTFRTQSHVSLWSRLSLSISTSLPHFLVFSSILFMTFSNVHLQSVLGIVITSLVCVTVWELEHSIVLKMMEV